MRLASGALSYVELAQGSNSKRLAAGGGRKDMAGAAQRTHWTTCIDFGTAASKASICTPPRSGASPADLVHPLRIGSICGEPNPYVAQSALLFDRGRIYFGWHA